MPMCSGLCIQKKAAFSSTRSRRLFCALLMPARLRTLLPDFVWALFAAVFFTYKIGYLFGDIDGEELLPVVYRLLDPSLYPGDPFVNAAADVQPIRAAFTYTLVALGKLMPLSTVALMLHGLCLTVTALCLMRIARALFPDAPWAAPLAPLLTMVYFGTWTLGGNAYLDNMLLPHSFAAAGGTAAALLFIRRRYVTAGIAVGISALYQPLLAGQLMAMLVAVRIAGARTEKWKEAGKFVGAFLLAVSPLLIAYLLHPAPPVSAAEHALFTERYFVARHGLHYLPSLYPRTDWLHFCALTIVGLLLVFRYRHPARKSLIAFVGSGVAAMVLYTILVEGIGSLDVCAVQAFKSSVWIAAAMAVVVAGYVGKGLTMLLPFSPRSAAVLALPLIGILFCGAVFTHTPGFAGHGLGGNWYRVGNYPVSDLTRIHHYLRDSTPRAAVVLTTPVDLSLLCEAQRSTPVSYKGFLHHPKAFLEWDHRYRCIYALSHQTGQRETSDQSSVHAELYNKLTSAHFDTVCNYQYRIANADAAQDSAMTVVRREGDWLLLGRR